jgi:hypothetical protein
VPRLGRAVKAEWKPRCQFLVSVARNGRHPSGAGLVGLPMLAAVRAAKTIAGGYVAPSL